MVDCTDSRFYLMLGIGGGFLLIVFGTMIAALYQQRKFHSKKMKYIKGEPLGSMMPEDSISMAGALPPTAPSEVTGYCKSMRSVKTLPRGHAYPNIYADSDYASMVKSEKRSLKKTGNQFEELFLYFISHI